jgi:UDP-GlcNAc3NAcA epimerase
LFAGWALANKFILRGFLPENDFICLFFHNMSKILTIVGARPQFIKASALSRALSLLGVQEVLVHTGQHFDDNMAEIFFRELEIPVPMYNLGIHSLMHGAMTGRMMEEIERVLLIEKPSVVVVYGDTNSTLAGALAAVKLHIPVAHVEAGLRSYDMKMPEEINRIITDRISSFLFCPTKNAVKNLMREGFDGFPTRIENTGDVMFDIALHYGKNSASKSQVISQHQLGGKPFVLATLHRQENTDDIPRLSSILEALNLLSSSFDVVLPLHPRTRRIIENENIRLKFKPIEPLGYFDMVELLKNCSFVLTDSGGVQKEAYFFKRHCLIARDETEWTELVDLGYNFLAGADTGKIVETGRMISQLDLTFSETPFGSGDAAIKIAQILKESI